MLIDSLPLGLKATVTEMGGCESPDHERVLSNIDNSRRDNLNYLHTYFPRSYNEIQDVLGELNRTAPQFGADLREKREIRILSVGCGTGGDVMGLLYFIYLKLKNCSVDEEALDVAITVDLVDGNSDAVSLAEQILVETTRGWFRSAITIKTAMRRFSAGSDLTDESGKCGRYDFIVASKFLQELSVYRPYFRFIGAFRNNLAETGLMVILTTVDRQAPRGLGNGGYIPVCLNEETNLACHEYDEEIATVYPLPCRAKPHCSKLFCYTRFICNETNSSYAARVLARKKYADRLLPVVKAGRYMVNSTFGKDPYCHVPADVILAA